ncbi:MAG: amidohydrolase [Planctomycetota bacterium]
MPPRPTRRAARRGPGHAWILAAACLGLTLVGVVGASRSEDGASASEERLVLFYNGTFHRGFDPQDSGAYAPSLAEAVLASDGRIVRVGSFAEVSASAEGRAAEQVDLGGGHAFPGFNDAHVYLERFGASLEQVDLAGSATYDEVVRRIRERAAEQPADSWIVARGWDRTTWADGAWPEHGPLSSAVPLHPVLAFETGGHAVLVNAAALALAGLDGEELPADPEGGEIVRADGRATGVLVGTAIRFVAAKLDAPTDETRVRHFLRAQEALFARGITAVHDMGVDARGVELLRGLRDDGRLKLRVAAYLRGDAIATPEEARKLADVGGDGLALRVVGVAMMLDGALGSRAAALSKDYADAPGRRGLLRMDVERFSAQVDVAARAGLQPATNAVGDRAVRIALDAYGRAAQDVEGFAGLRPRIEHLEVVAESDFARLAELGVIPSLQPAQLTDSLRWIEARLGRDRASRAHAWRRLADGSTLPIVFGSDAPLGRPRPLEWLHAALTRQDAAGAPKGGFHPEQRVTAVDALAAMTSAPAFVIADEELRGLLLPGHRCDLTVVDVDLTQLTATSAQRALDASLLMTVVNGEVVHRKR